MAVSDFLFFALSPKIHKTEPVTGEEDINNLNLIYIYIYFAGPFIWEGGISVILYEI
jgi:hypothetical protein